MRIRKRQVPFPLSSLSPVPISDPLLSLNRPPPVPVPVVVQLHPTVAPRNDAVNPNENPPQPSDHLADHHPQPIGKGSAMINGWEEEKMKKEKKEEEDRLELLQEEDKKEEDGEKGNHISKENILGAKTVSGFLLESSTNSSQVLGRWSEGERAFPPKKRRGMGFERPDIIHLNSSKAVNKTKTNSSNKKSWCSTSTSRKNDDDEDNDVDLDHDQEKKEHSTTTSTNKETKMVSNKNKSRGGALMEGSRCSRVNGRGWRCCQQTLVGYSLCEHHLGKGRLRSMTSVRSRSLAAKSSAPPPPPQALPKRDDVNLDDKAVINKVGDADDQGVAENEDFKGNDRNGEETKNNNKKRMKLGMVKARSISSLLGQINGAIPMADFSK